MTARLFIPWLLVALLAPRSAFGAPPDPGAIYAGEAGWSRAAHLVRLERQHPRRDAHYWSGMALLKVGLRSSALLRFERVLALGPGRYFEEAAARLGEDLAVPLEQDWSARGPLDLSGLSAPLSARLAHKLGLHHLRRGELTAARRWLERNPPRAQTSYLLAIISLAQGRRDQAREHLQDCLRLAPTTAGSSSAEQKELGELARLALARLDLEAQRLPRAMGRYLAVPLGSPHFFRARQELAWLYLQRGEPERALAQRVILKAPRFAGYFYPDGLMVEAAALYARCHLQRARETARALKGTMVRSLEILALFLRRRPEERSYYLEAMAAAAGQGEALGQEHLKALLADAGFRRVFLVVRQLQRERGLLAQTGATALQREVAAELDARLVRAQREAGEVTRRVLTALAAELRALRQQSEELIFEVEQRGAAAAIRRRSGGAGERAVSAEQRPLGREVRWPFEGELWPDEINHLMVRLPSRCAAPRNGSPTGARR